MLNIKLIGIGQGCYVIDSYKSHLSKKFPVAFTLDFSEPGATNTVPAVARAPVDTIRVARRPLLKISQLLLKYAKT